MPYFTYVSDIVIARLWNFIMCPATIRSENMSEQAQRDQLQTQSQDDEQARWNPLPAWIAMKKGVTRKEFTLTSWKIENCELQEGQNYLDSMQETHKWSHTSSSKIGENW